MTEKMHIKQLKNVVGQVSVLPTPTAELSGVVYQYIGATDVYQHGYIYECVEINEGVYGWERVDVQPGGSRGRFLAIWNCVTGLAESNPPISPYEYKTGDYFVIGSVSSATPVVNYKPDGTSYVIGVASTTVETNEVAVDDTYFFDGTNWKLQSNSNKTVTYANIAGDIYDNASATTALNAKADNTTVNSHIANTSNPHSVTKAQVGLGNVDNTSDLNKPISTATQSALDGKQATISDLATIRSNAQAGKAASDTIATYGNIVTHNVSEFATAAQGAKADTAVQPSDLATVATSGSYTDLSNTPTIPTVNNSTITITQGGVTKGSFTLNQASGDTIALDAGGGSIDAIDGVTITKNSDDEIQAVATINANTAVGATNPVYDWVGTLAEYNAQDIENQHPDWICYITDDVSGGASVYTKAEVDNGFVALTGAQTVAGIKMFIDNISNKETSITRGTAPNADKYSDINFIDTNGKWLAGFEHTVRTDKTSTFAMIVSDMVNDTGNIAGSIILEQKSNGTVITGCPASGATANSILTNVACSIGDSGYVKFGNGLIIQWGSLTTTGADSRWVAFPTAFSSWNSYSVTINPKGSSNAAMYTIAINNPTTTGFTAYSGGNVRSFQALWIAIGY